MRVKDVMHVHAQAGEPDPAGEESKWLKWRSAQLEEQGGAGSKALNQARKEHPQAVMNFKRTPNRKAKVAGNNERAAREYQSGYDKQQI